MSCILVCGSGYPGSQTNLSFISVADGKRKEEQREREDRVDKMVAIIINYSVYSLILNCMVALFRSLNFT